jgi:Sulfotransferase family
VRGSAANGQVTVSAPVFIIGSPRSGTTALAYALATHSALWTSAETQFLSTLFGNGRANGAFEDAYRNTVEEWLAAQRVTRAEFLASLGVGIDALICSRSGGRSWIDHTPHYVYMADTLAEMFPTARFIHILRDGRRVTDSMIHFGDRLNGDESRLAELPMWSLDFIEACLAWATSVRAGLDFCGRHPGRCRTVVNEDVTARPREHFEMLLRFLGVPYEPGPVKWWATQRVNSSFVPDGTIPLPEPGWRTWSAERRDIFERYAGGLIANHGLAMDAG